MKINEVSAPNTSIVKLTALAQFVSERSKETNAEIGINIDSFIELAHGMGISMTRQGLYDLVDRPPLNNLIKDISKGKVVFQGQDSEQEEKMPDNEAEKIVSKMAKRASKI